MLAGLANDGPAPAATVPVQTSAGSAPTIDRWETPVEVRWQSPPVGSPSRIDWGPKRQTSPAQRPLPLLDQYLGQRGAARPKVNTAVAVPVAAGPNFEPIYPPGARSDGFIDPVPWRDSIAFGRGAAKARRAARAQKAPKAAKLPKAAPGIDDPDSIVGKGSPEVGRILVVVGVLVALALVYFLFG